MSSRPSKTLQNKWNKLLKKSGFEDIEDSNGLLKEWSRKLFQVKGKYIENLTKQGAKEEYYRLAGHFLYDYKGFEPTSRYIWELHANGMSMREIVQKIKRPSKSTIGTIIKNLSNEMIRMYKVNSYDER
jgi:hypothetical protein